MSRLREEEFDQKINIGLWKRLAGYAWRSKKLVIFTIFSMLCVVLVDIAYPLFNKYAIDSFITPGSMQGLGWFFALYVIAIAFQSLGVVFYVSGAGKLEMQISYDIRQEVFLKLQKLSFSFYDKTAVGYLMSRMISDVARLSEMIAWSIVDVLWSLGFVVGCMVAMFSLNWQLAFIALCVIPFLAIACMYFQKKILKYQREVRKTNSRITGAFNEGIMGAVTTKTLVREQANLEDFQEITTTMRKVSVRSAVLSAIFMPIVMLLSSIGTALALYQGGREVLLGIIGFGTLSAFLSYTTQLFDPIQQLARILAEFQSAQAAAERVLSLLDAPLDIIDAPEVEEKFGDSFSPKIENWPAIHGDITFKDVSFSYIPEEPVISHFNLHVTAGKSVALVGETGAGKSTIINLICRFYEPTSGEILIDGVDYRKRSQLWLQRNLGYVLQSPHLFSGTIRDNIRYARKDATDEEVRRAAQMVHAESFILEQPEGYDTEVGEGGIRLSTGQKQLISFARVILADPRIFVLDEATSSIDTQTEQLIQHAITTVLKGRTSFIVAHRLSTIRNSDLILVIGKGGILEQGTHKQLLEKKGAYYKLYSNQ